MDMGDDMAETWGALGFFILTTIVCLTVHFFIVLPAVYFITTRKNPFVYMWGMMQPIAEIWKVRLAHSSTRVE